MINILFVAWEFPPLTAGGVQRPLYFVKYLREFGINPIVITVPASGGKFGKEDHILMEEIPDNTPIEKIDCEFKNHSYLNKFTKWVDYYFSLVEKHGEAWETFIKSAMPGLVEKYKPKAIYVTIPPFSMAPLWVSIGKQYKLPVLLDFRDAWSQWVNSPYATRFHYKALVRLENKCINSASALICTSRQIADDLKRIHPKLQEEKIVVITNGFDRELRTWQPVTPQKKSGKFIIGYVGSFYYAPQAMEDMFKPWWKKPVHRMLQYTPHKENWLYRTPYFLFRSLDLLFKKYPDYKNSTLIRFAGIKPDWIDAQINLMGLQENCEFVGHLNFNEVIKFEEDCDALLITSSKVIGGRDYSIAGKTYEYFTIGKPIIAFVTEGAQKDILQPSGMSILCNPDDTEGSAGLLKSLFDGEISLQPDHEYLKQFKRKNLTEQLAGMIRKIVVNN